MDGDEVVGEEIVVSGGENFYFPVLFRDNGDGVALRVQGDAGFTGEVDVGGFDVNLIGFHEVEQISGGLAECDDLVAVQDGHCLSFVRCLADVNSL